MTSANTYVTPRQAQAAADLLGDARTTEITGPGGLSGATMTDLVRLVAEAEGATR